MGTTAYDGYSASVGLNVVFHSPEQEGIFIAALTGGDTDICLAIENLVNEVLGIDQYSDVPRIYVEPED